MDLTTLNRCLKNRKQLDELYEHREHLYNTVHSPSFSDVRIVDKRSPVEKAMERLQKTDDRISQLIIDQADLIEAILEWLYRNPEDDTPEYFKRIIICHYIEGMSWQETTRHVLEHYESDSAKNHVYRYFKSHPEG